MADLAGLPTEVENKDTSKDLEGKHKRKCLKQKIQELCNLIEEFREEAKYAIEETKEETKNDEWKQ